MTDGGPEIGDWRSATGHARQLVTRAPKRLEGWTALVESLANLGQGEAAEQAARHSLEHFPEQPEVHVLLAKALRAQGRTAEALAELAAAERAGGSGDRADVDRRH